jgi:hypothetical protein
VLGSAGLTLGDGPHSLAIDGHPFRTWCAFDALGIPAALASNALVATECAVCERPIQIELRAGRPSGSTSARLWLAAGGADMRAEYGGGFTAIPVEDGTELRYEGWGRLPVSWPVGSGPGPARRSVRRRRSSRRSRQPSSARPPRDRRTSLIAPVGRHLLDQERD